MRVNLALNLLQRCASFYIVSILVLSQAYATRVTARRPLSLVILRGCEAALTMTLRPSAELLTALEQAEPRLTAERVSAFYTLLPPTARSRLRGWAMIGESEPGWAKRLPASGPDLLRLYLDALALQRLNDLVPGLDRTLADRRWMSYRPVAPREKLYLEYLRTSVDKIAEAARNRLDQMVGPAAETWAAPLVMDANFSAPSVLIDQIFGIRLTAQGADNGALASEVLGYNDWLIDIDRVPYRMSYVPEGHGMLAPSWSVSMSLFRGLNLQPHVLVLEPAPSVDRLARLIPDAFGGEYRSGFIPDSIEGSFVIFPIPYVRNEGVSRVEQNLFDVLIARAKQGQSFSAVILKDALILERIREHADRHPGTITASEFAAIAPYALVHFGR